MEWYHVIGTVAALLTTFGFVPQIIKMYRIKSSDDISIVTLLQFLTGTGLWTIYGIHIRDIIITTANIISFTIIVIAIIVYYHYKRSKEV